MQLSLPITEKEYYLIVNKKEIYDRAQELGERQVILFERDKFDADDVMALNNSEKQVVFAFFCDKDDKILHHLVCQLEPYIPYYSLKKDTAFYNEFRYESIDAVVRSLKGIIKIIEYDLKDDGLISTTDYENRCGNCHSVLDPEDKYCKYCGTKRGEGAFKPYRNVSYGLYGPCGTYFYKCHNCGKIFEYWTIGSSDVKNCPSCGSAVEEIDYKEDE
ncbi:Zinc ribbon domain-containing protein [Butyrivibrio sp. ob235]|uniref:zinc ribbon domain-containing protein n=1 Tax=Butyrivibrio sp. ob235 TaxID=1761780 RepID=UPI0008D72F19|nr:zinc ribbon domain-containing protein [Butyrivibrio sp. ob235]SEM18252.1 Zinc ribbon domain-containing protein [Butyrivibrio sp. ob235]